MEQDGGNYNPGLNSAVVSTGECYEEIGRLYEEQPRYGRDLAASSFPTDLYSITSVPDPDPPGSVIIWSQGSGSSHFQPKHKNICTFF